MWTKQSKMAALEEAFIRVGSLFNAHQKRAIQAIVVETAKSVKSLGLKDNSTNQIRMKIYSEHIQTARVETKTVKE